MSDTIEVDRDELEAIVDERVEEKLQNRQTKRSRRSVLASLAAAAGVGAVGGYPFIESVTATDGSAVGQIGSPTDKVNVYAHSLGDSNNPVDEFYVEDEFVTDTQQSLTVDDLTVNQSASIDDLKIGGDGLASTGDFLMIGPSTGSAKEKFSTTSTSYVGDNSYLVLRTQWDSWVPSGAQGAVLAIFKLETSSGDVRIQNGVDGQVIAAEDNISAGATVTSGPTVYTPTTTSNPIPLSFLLRTDDGSSSTDIDMANVQTGVQY